MQSAIVCGEDVGAQVASLYLSDIVNGWEGNPENLLKKLGLEYLYIAKENVLYFVIRHTKGNVELTSFQGIVHCIPQVAGIAGAEKSDKIFPHSDKEDKELETLASHLNGTRLELRICSHICPDDTAVVAYNLLKTS